MSRLRRILLGNWPLKLAAIGLATVLYAGVALSENTRSWDGPVTIEVLRAPPRGALLELPGAVTEISYRAPVDVASRLTAGSFRASIDLSVVEPRVGAEPVEVPVDVFPVDPRVRIVDYTPRSFNVRLDEVVARRMPVTIDHGSAPEGIELGPVISQPSQVVVRGASSRVSNVRSVSGRIGIDGSGINIDQDVPVEAFDELGALVPGVDVEPPSVRVRADVARQLAYVTLPVVPALSGDPASGYRIDTVTVTPSTVTVSGEDPVIRQLESITTGPVDVSGLSEELEIDVPFVLPVEVTAPDAPEARVRVTFTPATGSRTVEVGTALVDTRFDRTYRVGHPSVQVVVAGAVASLDELDAASLIAELPVSGLDAGVHAVVPLVRLPAGLEAARLVPETVLVTVAEPS